MQRSVPPIFNVDIRLLVQLTDNGGRDLAASQVLGDIFHTPDRYTCQVHLYEGFFHTAFPAAVPFDNSSLKGNPFELGNLEGNIPGSGSEVSAIVAAAVALARLVTLVPSCSG